MRKSGSTHGSSSTDRPKKFRFKSGTEDPREHKKRRGHSKGDEEGERHHRRKRKRREYPTPPQEDEQADEEASHPFPREPADPLESDGDAFRASLFDALADDEGAAAYWENVYNQPIHVYSRPTVQNTATGELEEMNDEEYAEHVKQQMWERKHPEIVFERRKREREKKLEEEERTRRREEFVRHKEQAAWERSQRWRSRGDDADARNAKYEYEFAGEKHWNHDNPVETQAERQEYLSAWATYLSAWDQLKLDLLKQGQGDDTTPAIQPSKRIPWPVLKSKPPTKLNIEAFMRHAPCKDQEEKLRVLKAERVRWHPDKVQQRFGGAVDDGTMRLVTGVFQVVDSMVEEERKRVDGL